jgi:hypothetical protein
MFNSEVMQIRRAPILRGCFASWMALVLLLGLGRSSSAADLEELKVKAGAIRIMAVRTEWREEDFITKDAPIVIGMVGSNPFKEEHQDFTALLTEGKIGTHEVKVKVLQGVEEIEQCHIVYISLKEQSHLKDVIAKMKTLKDRRVLTISDISEFKKEGGMAEISAKQAGPKKFTPHIDVNWGTLKSVGWKFDNQLTVAIMKMKN